MLVLCQLLFMLASSMAEEYERTHFSLEQEERGHNEYFDIATSVLHLQPILFEDEWRAIDSIKDDAERRRRELC